MADQPSETSCGVITSSLGEGSGETTWLEQRSEGKVQLLVSWTSVVVLDCPNVSVKSQQAGSLAYTASFSPAAACQLEENIQACLFSLSPHE